MFAEMCVDVHTDMCADMCVDLCTDMCADMRAACAWKMWVHVRVDTLKTCVSTREHVQYILCFSSAETDMTLLTTSPHQGRAVQHVHTARHKAVVVNLTGSVSIRV